MACFVVEWQGVPVKQVVSGGFWVVFDGFRWLRVISDGFRWFAVLVVTRISQHTEELFLYHTHERAWLTEVIRSCYSKKGSRKKIIFLLPPSRLKISDYFLYSIVLFPILLFPILYSISYKRLLLTEIKKNSHKTQSKWSIADYLRRGVWAGSVTLTGRRGELNQNGEISPSDGERWQVCKIVRCDIFSSSQKSFTVMKKEYVIS